MLVGEVLETLGGFVLLAEVSHWSQALRVYSAPRVAGYLCFLCVNRKVISQLPVLCCLLPCLPCHHGLYWELSAKINSFFFKSPLLVAFYLSTRKATNTIIHQGSHPWGKLILSPSTAIDFCSFSSRGRAF